MSGPTPGPWFAGSQNDQLYIVDRRPAPSNDYQRHDADCEPVAKVFAARGSSADANAAHIVRCVNERDELVRTLEWALSRIDPQNRGEYYDRAADLVAAAKKQV